MVRYFSISVFRRFRLAGAGGLLFAGLVAAKGQEAVQMSIAGADAAAARRRAASTQGYYNLMVGPTAWSFSAGLETDYNSNVNNTEYDPKGDLIFRPQINTGMLWPITDQNSLSFTLGGGYSAYLQNQNLDQWFLTPLSGLSFDVYAGDFWINLHDRFSMTEYSYQDPTVVGTGDYSQFQNALGPTVVWDLNKIVLKLSYDQVNYVSFSSGNNLPDAVSEVGALSAGYAIKPQMLAGLEVGGDLISYSGQNLYYRNAKQWNVGGFYDTPVSDYIHVTAHAGYTAYSPDGGTTLYASDFNGMYAQFDLTHRVNEYVSYTLSGGRMITLAYAGGTLDEYFARLGANWNILHQVTLGTSFSYENGTYLSGYSETFDRYGFGLSVARGITSKLTASLGYQYYLRNSNEPGMSYTINVVSLNLAYKF